MLLFDTSAIIDWMSSDREDLPVVSRVGISALSVSKLLPRAMLKGINHTRALELFLSEVDILPLNAKIARIASDGKNKLIKKGKEKSLIDLWIGATANYYDLKLITLDKDFEDISEVLKFDYEIIN
ncbi:MAG: type II toxin-antitoxin system VapC family toxin [Candidatus Hodarchaeales archaeon]|jgi:predicted nucleic acid-binding protein